MTILRWDAWKTGEGYTYHGTPDYILALLKDAIARIEAIPEDHKKTSTVYFSRDQYGGYIRIESKREF